MMNEKFKHKLIKISNILVIPLLILGACSLVFKDYLNELRYIEELRYFFALVSIIVLVGLVINLFSKNQNDE